MGLDPNQIIGIRELLREVGEDNTVILSSHILSEVEATCTRVIIINDGDIVANGTSSELQEQHGGEGRTGLEQIFIHLTRSAGNSAQDDEVTPAVEASTLEDD